MPNRPAPASARLNLALQGGGAHGAFTWGVLDRLLDEPDIEIGHISGTSAGALNGAALATGFARGGRDGAKAQLEALWNKVAEAGSAMSLLLLPLRKPGLGIWDDAMPLLSPYQTNPLGMTPLREVLNQVIDVSLLADPRAPRLHVNALNVHSGVSRVFGPSEISVDALLASACAPLMFQAVRIDGESYWDGSYGCNPPLWPLYDEQPDADILLVELTPVVRPETPTTAKNILNRINELASTAGLVDELRAIDLHNREVAGADVRLHLVSLPESAAKEQVEPSVKRTVSRVLFAALRASGVSACSDWLAAHRADLGLRSSADLGARYPSRRWPPRLDVPNTRGTTPSPARRRR